MIAPILIKTGAALTATAAVIAGVPALDNAFGTSEPAAMPVAWEQQRSVDAQSATSSHVAVLKAEEERKEAERKAKKAAERKAKKEAERQEAERQAAVAAERQATQDRQAAQAKASRSQAQGGTPAQNRALGMQMCAERGWSAYQCEDLGRLWEKESGWSSSAHNGSSGAHGIPQSLPGSKMSSHGSDWATSPSTQIAWGLDYIAGRYGNPSSAWAHSQSHGWY